MEMSRSLSRDDSSGVLYVVSIGPGDLDNLTPLARRVIERSEVVVGNRLYLDQMAPILEGKEIVRSGMGKELERAREAMRLAASRTVALISGGDAGVYGMASIVLELAEKESPELKIEVIPGVTAATAAASRLGSPLSGDFLVLSLSDLLTPWGVIEERLDLGFRMGVPMALYNPRSRNRPDNLHRALGIGLRHASPFTPVGVVRNAFREDEMIKVTDLSSLHSDDSDVDMHSIVIIGGQGTRCLKGGGGDRMVTQRGYHRKYVY